MVRTRFTMVVLGLAVGLAAGTALLNPELGSAHEGETHARPEAASMPADEFILNDAMRLIAADFGTLRTQGAGLGDPETQAKVVRATENAQRYMRTVQRRWTADRGFTQYAEAFLKEWHAAEAAARAGDASAVEAAIPGIGASCKACHEVYRPE